MTADSMLKMLIGELQFQNAIYCTGLKVAQARVAELEAELAKLKEEKKPDGI